MLAKIHSKVLLNKPLLKLYALTLIWSVAEGALIFYIPVFLETKVNNLTLVGIFLALNSFASFSTDFTFGFLSEVTQYRKFFRIAVMCALGLLPFLVAQPSALTLALLVILWGIEYEVFFHFGSNIYLAGHTDSNNYGIAASTEFATRNFGFFLGPILADYLRLEAEELFAPVMLIIYVVALIYMLLAFGFKDRNPAPEPKGKKMTFMSEVRIVKQHFRNVWPHMLLALGIAIYEAVFMLYGGIHFVETTTIAGLITAASVLAYSVMPPLIVYLVKDSRYGLLCALGGAATAASAVLFQNVKDQFLILLLVMLTFTAVSAITVVKETLFIRLLSRINHSEDDEMVSVNSLSANVGYISVALIGGMLVGMIGFDQVVAGAGVILMVACIGFVWGGGTG